MKGLVKLIPVLSILFSTPIFAADAAPAIAIDSASWLRYADNLQTCTPGTFVLADPLATSLSQPASNITYIIVGMKGDYCEMTISRVVPNSNPPNTLKIICNISKTNLTILAQSVKDLVAGKPVSSEDPASKIMQDSCKAGS